MAYYSLIFELFFSICARNVNKGITLKQMEIRARRRFMLLTFYGKIVKRKVLEENCNTLKN